MVRQVKRWFGLRLSLAVAVISLVLSLSGPMAWAALPRPVARLTDQVEALQTLVDQQDWVYIRNYIHGPMGTTRVDLSALARRLSPEQQKAVEAQSRQIGKYLVAIDEGAKLQKLEPVVANQQALKQAIAQLVSNFDD